MRGGEGGRGAEGVAPCGIASRPHGAADTAKAPASASCRYVSPFAFVETESQAGWDRPHLHASHCAFWLTLATCAMSNIAILPAYCPKHAPDQATLRAPSPARTRRNTLKTLASYGRAQAEIQARTLRTDETSKCRDADFRPLLVHVAPPDTAASGIAGSGPENGPKASWRSHLYASHRAAFAATSRVRPCEAPALFRCLPPRMGARALVPGRGSLKDITDRRCMSPT